MPGGKRNLRQWVQDQAVQIARDFCGDSLGGIKGRLQSDLAQLENLAEQLPEGDARARIQSMLDSYLKLASSLDQTARDLGVEDAVNEAARKVRATQEAPDEAGGAIGQVTGAVGQVAGQVVEGAQAAIGQALGQVGQITENLPGGQLLSRTTDESGQTVQRAVNESGDIVEIILDEAGDLVNEKLVANLADLPTEEEYQNEEGQTIRTVKDRSGALIQLQLGEDGSILDLQVLPSPQT